MSEDGRSDRAGTLPTGSEAPSARALAPLRVWDRLEVGPVRVEPKRVSATYRVVRGKRFVESELTYRFEEDVFDPAEPASRNLAAMVTAQVALNYGLFCDRIVFHGPFDAADRKFLVDMAENTAREIYVKKFLEPNLFLRGSAAKLPVVKRDRYLRAQLEFDDGGERFAGDAPWPVDRNSMLILSSGGKDSLLSFGLLREAGYVTHPIFVNESGRHWFTALNAYRHFQKSVPNSGRVWTDADRLFSWMLRQLPFIRPDFLRVRSDEYPIRLWTVAVFLFGALPIARRRGLGRILIGDEFDTTERSSFEGIPHYNGLYDQSRYFDNALTRYYARKKWRVSQFSIIRPLSELLVEKVLSERYPELLRLQMSCHAAHKEGERVAPCGQCEKCRRIVGMLVAVGGDPMLCGYTPQQIAACLKTLAVKGVHQERDGAEHMGHLLLKKGAISERRLGEAAAGERPHVLQLRFERERSPIDAIPADLRTPLYRILLEHAEGAVERNGRVWVAMDPLSEQSLSRPYPFESPSGAAPSPGSEKPSDKTPAQHCILGRLTWPEAQARLKKVDIALLPVGAFEQHGPHLPLDTDAFDAEYMAIKVAAACSEPRPLVLPLIPYGVSYHHDDFPGTISVNNETLSHMVYDVGMSAARNGITKLIVVNGHGGNVPALHFAAQMINRDARIFTCVESGETSDADVAAMVETDNDVHAGEIETSTSLAVRPELVRMDKARRFVPRFSSRYLEFSSRRSVDWYARTSKIAKSGVMGDPTKATREKGERIWAVMIRNMVEFVEHLKGMSLDEIFQRNRY